MKKRRDWARHFNLVELVSTVGPCILMRKDSNMMDLMAWGIFEAMIAFSAKFFRAEQEERVGPWSSMVF